MSNQAGLVCPDCGGTDRIHVTFIGTCRLTSDGSEDVGDHEYDDNSTACCYGEGCPSTGSNVLDFRPKPVVGKASPIEYRRQFLPLSDEELGLLWDDLYWEHRDGAPRFESWMNDFGQRYTYGKGAGERTYESRGWHPFAQNIREIVCPELQGCFINGYGDGSDHLGWHADDSPWIDHTKPIVVVSFGAERPIWFRRIGSTDQVSKVLLENGSVLTMLPGMQQTHQHRIPKSDRTCGKRISFTFRGLLRHPNPEGSPPPCPTSEHPLDD